MAGITLPTLAALAVLSALPWTRAVGMMLASLILHEWAHSFVARWCGAKSEPFRFTLYGMMMRVRRMENLHPRLRVCVYAAGPVMNIAIACWAYTVHHLSYVGVFWLRDLAFYNAILAGFNLLPFLPLDGGRIAQHFLGNIFGILRANRFLIRLGKTVAVVLAALGIIQIILFSYNFTLLLAAIFLWRRNKSIQPELRMECFMTLLKKARVLRGDRGKKQIKTKPLILSAETPVSRALERLGWSYIREFRIRQTDGTMSSLNEEELLSRVFSPAHVELAVVPAMPIGATVVYSP